MGSLAEQNTTVPCDECNGHVSQTLLYETFWQGDVAVSRMVDKQVIHVGLTDCPRARALTMP